MPLIKRLRLCVLGCLVFTTLFGTNAVLASSGALPFTQKTPLVLPDFTDVMRGKVISDIAPHKALYDLKMISTRVSGSIASVSGTMAFEWQDTCDAWTTHQKFNLKYIYLQDEQMDYKTQFSAFEQKDGSEYTFVVQRFHNDTLAEEFKGGVKRGTDEVMTVSFDNEALKQQVLSKGVLLPSEHTVELLRLAKAGSKFFNAKVVDGGDVHGVMEANAFIGAALEQSQFAEQFPVIKVLQDAGNAKTKDADIKNFDVSLYKPKAYKISMAFYSEKKQGTDTGEPDYQMTMIMQDNGVVTGMIMDYPEFSMIAELKALQGFDKPVCSP